MGEKSLKTIKNLSELVGDKQFKIPRRLGDAGNEEGELCMVIQVGSNKWFIPVEKAVEIPYEAFCVMRDSNIEYQTIGKEFDPLA